METNQVARQPGEHALDWASRILPGRSALAEKLGVSVAAVGNWKSRGVPVEHCPAIEQATAGQVRCEELRQDVQWSVLRQAPANIEQPATENVAQGVTNV